MNARHAAALLSLAVLVPARPARPAEAPEARVRVDAAAVGAPISPYVYGQFIEHLGRCIYGGLWAEMLEDRKFYYPVTGEAPAWEMFTPGKPSWEGEGHPYELLVRSPWMILGEKNSVTMVREGAYAGEHSPRVTLPGGGVAAGLMQERLGLQDGRDYVGRIVAGGGRVGRSARGEPGLGRGRQRPADRDDHAHRDELLDPRPALPRRRHDRQRAPRDRRRAAPGRSRSAPCP